MKKLLFIALALFTLAPAMAQEERKDRIISSYLYAFGNLPAQSEIDYWMTDALSSKNVSELINAHKNNIKNNQSLADRAIRHSYLDAMGREPRSDEYNYWRGQKLPYSVLMDNHVNWLRSNPAEFSTVIKRSYQTVFNRQPQNIELNNWKNAGARSFISLVQTHQKNVRAGMFAPANATSQKLISDPKSGVNFKPSDAVKNEMGKFIATNGGTVISTGGGNVISTGGGNVISTGGGN